MNIRFNFSSTGGRSTAGGWAGRIGVALFFSIFLVMGLIFAALMVKDISRSHQVARWRSVPCTILSAEGIDNGGDNPYAFGVRYHYEIDGQSHTGQRFRRKNYSTGDYADVQTLLDRYPPDSRATCLVNPDDPNDAVLEADSPWMAAMLILPGIFIVIGGGGVWFSLHRRSPGQKSVPLSASGKQNQLSPGGQVAFFGIFLVAGLLMAIFMGGWLWKFVDARHWPAVPATVLASRVQSHSDEDGTTYSIDILYSYTVNDKEYRSNRYSFVGGSSSGSTGKQKVVREHPVGKKALCYVDPDDPAYAVLHRGWSWELLLGLFPLPFLAVGFFGIAHTIRTARNKRQAMPDQPQPTQGRRAIGAYQRLLKAGRAANTGVAGRVTLTPGMSPKIKLILLLVFTVFWNAIIAIMVSQAFGNHGGGSWFFSCFMIPFVLVGVGLIVATVYTALASTNPRPTITLDHGFLSLGMSTRMGWSFTGNDSRIENLKIILEGRESATYQRGTDTTTDHHTFARSTLIESDNPIDIRSGQADLKIPADTMHSFDAGRNKIEWRIIVHGVIAKWPDVKEEFVIQVEPKQRLKDEG